MRDQKVAFFVDDDADFLGLIPASIQHPHFEVRTYCAENGYRIVDEVIKTKPDVLFIDFTLPRANAGQILPILRSVQRFSNLPVYFITGFPRAEILPFVEALDYKGILAKGDTFKTEVLKILDALDRTVSI